MPALTQGMENYNTYSGNPDVTGEALAEQMIASITAGDIPQSERAKTLRFGQNYISAEESCMDQHIG